VLVPTQLFATGEQQVWASDLDSTGVSPDTSSAVLVNAGPFARLLILAPGEEPAPGTEFGRTGAPIDQSINYSFAVQVFATDNWWNPITGVSDVVHLTSTDPIAVLPPDTPLTDGHAELVVRLGTGGFQQITATDVTEPSIPATTTEVRAISSGFHLEAEASPDAVRAGEPFTLTVRVTNDAGAPIREINSFVTIEVENSSTRDPGQGTLSTTRFQLLQGERSIAVSYTFAEAIVLVASDDLGNAPAVSNVVTVSPGPPSAVRLTADPPWVGGNKHAAVTARVVDAYENGVPEQGVVFELVSGSGTLSAVDSLTSVTGVALADYLSPRTPEMALIRAHSSGLSGDLQLETAFVDPNAAGGTVTNYPNPFHPEVGPTTIAYKLDDAANVTLRIFSLNGDLVRREEFALGAAGALPGMNEFVWNGQNGNGDWVASGGYILLVEATGEGETLHVMRRKIAVVR
jgi:hypothetical protein